MTPEIPRKPSRSGQIPESQSIPVFTVHPTSSLGWQSLRLQTEPSFSTILDTVQHFKGNLNLPQVERRTTTHHQHPPAKLSWTAMAAAALALTCASLPLASRTCSTRQFSRNHSLKGALDKNLTLPRTLQTRRRSAMSAGPGKSKGSRMYVLPRLHFFPVF